MLQCNHADFIRSFEICKARRISARFPGPYIFVIFRRAAGAKARSSHRLRQLCTVARMSHVQQIAERLHRAAPAELIFAHVAGMVMVNVIAGGRSYGDYVTIFRR